MSFSRDNFDQDKVLDDLFSTLCGSPSQDLDRTNELKVLIVRNRGKLEEIVVQNRLVSKAIGKSEEFITFFTQIVNNDWLSAKFMENSTPI